jgi:integrase
MFPELVVEYLERHARIKKKSWKEDERILNREFMPLWRYTKAKAITRRDVILALDAIVERNSPILANRALAVLRKMYNFGIQRDIVALNPCWNVPAPGKARSSDRVLSENELLNLWRVLHGSGCREAGFYKLLILTAQRSGELARAEWTELDLSSGWWVIPAEKSKNGLPYRVPLDCTPLFGGFSRQVENRLNALFC